MRTMLLCNPCRCPRRNCTSPLIPRSKVRCRMVRSKSTAVQSAGEGTSVDLDACAFEECREPCVLADSAGTVSLRNWDVGQQRRRKWRWGRRVRVACERRGGRVHAGGAAL